MAYDEDTCPICHQILDDPATTHCGHTACLACLLTWVAASNPETQPLDFRFKIPEKPSIDWLYFSCPLCRAQTYASFDGARREQLRLEGKQQDIDPDMDSIQNMTLQVGNTHRKVPPSISPFSGKIRTHRWDFFLVASRPDIIESVDLLLHDSFKHHRFVTLREPPFTKSSLGWGYFRFTSYITLREGWEWLSPDAVNSSSKDRGPKDRLPIDWCLNFDGFGEQLVMTAEFRKLDGVDSILPDLAALFNDQEVDVAGIPSLNTEM